MGTLTGLSGEYVTFGHSTGTGRDADAAVLGFQRRAFRIGGFERIRALIVRAEGFGNS